MELLPAAQRRAWKKKYADRKKNIYKKAEELSILCGNDVAVILFQPADIIAAAQPEVETWPKDQTEIKGVIRRYKAKCASTHASSSTTILPAIEDTNTALSSSSSSSSPSSSSSRSVLGKRNHLNLDLSLSGFYDSPMKIIKDDRGKKKLGVESDENINGENELCKNDNELRIGYEDQEALLAALEAKRVAVRKRIASLEATYV